MTKQMLKRMVWLLCISVALTACKEKTEIIEVVRSIKTITVSKQASEKIFKFSGLVAAVDSSGLSFQVGGQVELVKVDIGDRVKKGQVLAVLDPEPFQLEVDAIEAELMKARDNVTKTKAEYGRRKRIFEQGAGAERHVEVSEYNYKAAASAVNFQIARLDVVMLINQLHCDRKSVGLDSGGTDIGNSTLGGLPRQGGKGDRRRVIDVDAVDGGLRYGQLHLHFTGGINFENFLPG
jgi:hypothetical protein